MKSNPTSSQRGGLLSRHPRLIASGVGAVACVAALLSGRPAAAEEFTFHVEPAAAFWLDDPQAARFTPGLYLALRPGIALGRVVGLQWSYAFLGTAPDGDFSDNGAAHMLTAGVRLHPFGMRRPASEQLGGLFTDFNIGYTRTGELDRLGFDAGLGYNFLAKPWLSLGPVLRYGHIVQPNDIPNIDANDAQFLSVGLNLSFGSVASDAPPECPECVAEVRIVEKIVEKIVMVEGCADRDRDGTCDSDDRCPDKIGPPATLGCPIDPCSGEPLLVLVQFPYDSADLPRLRQEDPQTMDPVLDAVADAIAQDATCRVCIVGYASEEGPADYNLELSQRRASSVQHYMTAKGLGQARMPITGLGSSCQMVPETTRSLNRRVEFHRLDEGESCPKGCAAQ